MIHRPLAALAGVALLGAASAVACAQQQGGHHWAIVVHGGAGVIEKSQLGPEGDKAYRAGLDKAIHAEPRFWTKVVRRSTQ